MNHLYKFLVAVFLLSPCISHAQTEDTVWVNTLNFKDITKRKGTYQFPKDGEEWRKITMHYTLKCDAQTTQDGFACGEWDYLSYTIVHDSTGRIDSNAFQHSNFLVGDDSPDTFEWVQTPLFDTIYDYQYTRVVDQVNSIDSAIIGTGTVPSANMFKLPRTQYLFTASELSAGGLQAGEVTSISFNVKSLSGSMNNVQIRMTTTVQNNLNQFIEGPFQTVMRGSLNITATGEVKIENLEPFIWDGSSNILLEIAHNEVSPTAIYEIEGDLSSSGIAALPGDKRYRVLNNSFMEIDNASSVFAGLDSMVTIALWVKGDESLPQNTSVLEAKDKNGNRVINVHLPWSNGSIYWDAGNDGGSYDRINKAAATTNIRNQWNHWAFVKNAKTGDMKIYLNGQLWHSGTDKNQSMAGITQFRIGKGITSYQFRGDLDRLSVWKTALTDAEIKDLMTTEVTASHAQFANLLMSFNFDNYDDTKPSELWSNLAINVKANIHGNIDIGEYNMGEHNFEFLQVANRPMIKFLQANQLSHLDSTVWVKLNPRPKSSIALYQNAAKPLELTGFESGYASGFVFSYNADGSKRDSSLINSTKKLTKKFNTYYVPFEVVNNIEIGRYITPYGIGFDLGPDGFRWEYDVTDYAYLLSDMVTLSAGNQQELIDLKFEFIKGTPPRSVKRIDYYANRENRNYNKIADDEFFKEEEIDLDSTAKTFKLITRITGHGHNTDAGKNHCCEWADKKHYMKIDGKDALEWDIWQDDKCALNPLIDQGGNWSPPRAGWCPGAPVDDYNFDITKWITGNKVRLNYEIEPVPTDNLGQGGGNYVVSFHLVEYGDWNFKNDGSVTTIMKPNNWEFYNKMNPACATPKIIIKNTGSNAMTSALLRYGVVDGNPIVFGWTGNLAPDATEEVDLPFSVWDYLSPSKSQTFFAEFVKVNGVDDENPKNSRTQSTFDIPKVAPTNLELWFRNNSLADATIKLTNDQGKVVYEKLDGAPNVLNKESLVLDPGCYTLECVTENGFGLYYPLIPEVGNGLLRLSGNGFLQSFVPDFGKSTTYNFTVAYALSEDKIETTNWNLYPNPGNGLITIEAFGNNEDTYQAEVLNMQGQVVASIQSSFAEGLAQIDIQNQPVGIYVVRLQHGDLIKVFKVVKD